MGSVEAIPARQFTKGLTSMNTKQTKALHLTIAAMFAAFNATTKTEAADYKATAALLKTAALNDAEIVKAIRDDLFTTFGEEHKDAAQIRVNIVNNARRVAYGGTKDGKAIRGKGMSAMLEIVATVASVRELRKALSEAVPEALKGASGGDKKSGKKTTKTKTADLSRLPKDVTSEQAMTAARKILEFILTKFVKPSEVERTESINQCIAVLK